MDFLTGGKKSAVSKELLFRAALVIFIIEGLIFKLYQSINMQLNSDTVGMGMLSMEIWKHHNYLLSGYHVTAADTFFFTELLPFQLIPQILTGFDPVALKLVTFLIFVLGVAVLSAVVYLVSRQLNAALVFAALAANIAPSGYWAFAEPTTHNATIVFGGIILLLLLYINGIGKAETVVQPAKKKKAQAAEPAKLPWAYIACLAIVAFFTAFSDTIVIAWIIAPYLLVYLLLYKEKTRASNLAITSVLAVSALAYVLKTYVVSDWLKRPLGINSPSQILANLPLFFDAMGRFLLKGLLEALYWISVPGLAGLLSILGLVAVLGYAAWRLARGKGDQYLPAVLLASVAMMFGYFLLSDYVFDLGAGRYITFTALAIVMLVALFYPDNQKLFGGLVLALLALSAISSVVYVSTNTFSPNAQEYALIQYLTDNGLTHGYSTYQIANTITYLSGEEVIVRSVTFNTEGIEPNALLSCDRWYRVTPEKGFLLFDNTTLDADSRFVVDTLTSNINASPTQNQSYLIYSYSLSDYKK